MRVVPFGATGLKVSSLALGTMSFGGEADRDEAARIYARARDAGVVLFDTADVYNRGESERILGALTREHRDEVVIATKAYFPMGDGPNDRGSSRYHLERAVEASLRRLGTDRVDVFFLHRFDDATPLEESLRALERLVLAGKILYPAASNFAAWQVAKALGVQAARGWARIAAIQPMYNLAKRTAEIELLPMAASEGVAVTPYSPLGGGLLSGKYTREARPGAGRIVDNDMYATRYGDHFDLAGRFTALAQARGVHPVTLAVAWVARHPAVTCPLIGGRSVAQLEPALAAAELELDDALYAEITALSAPPPPATDRNEEGSGADYATVLRRPGGRG